jgi:hypothetical protein
MPAREKWLYSTISLSSSWYTPLEVRSSVCGNFFMIERTRLAALVSTPQGVFVKLLTAYS